MTGRNGAATTTRNMVSDEKNLPASFVPGKKRSDGSGIDMQTTKNVKWVARLGTENYSSPVVADGKVFIGTNDVNLNDPRYKPTGGGVLLCLDEATGKLLWRLVVPKLETGKRSTDYDKMELGICSTPCVEGNRVYVVTNRSEVVCLDTEGMANGNDGPFPDERRYTGALSDAAPGQLPGDADIIWRYDMISELSVFPARRGQLLGAGLRRSGLCEHRQRRGRQKSSLSHVAQPYRARQAHRPAGGQRRRDDRLAGVPRAMVFAFAGSGGR